MLNGIKFRSNRWELIATHPDVIAQLTEKAHRMCTQCKKNGILKLRLQDSSPYYELRKAGRFCDRTCFDIWWRSEAPKKTEYIY